MYMLYDKYQINAKVLRSLYKAILLSVTNEKTNKKSYNMYILSQLQIILTCLFSWASCLIRNKGVNFIGLNIPHSKVKVNGLEYCLENKYIRTFIKPCQYTYSIIDSDN